MTKQVGNFKVVSHKEKRKSASPSNGRTQLQTKKDLMQQANTAAESNGQGSGRSGPNPNMLPRPVAMEKARNPNMLPRPVAMEKARREERKSHSRNYDTEDTTVRDMHLMAD